ncbi:glutathione-dependent formaldehyde dehydrogenase [Ectothiorhodospiraceae bacterium 2226]|nr:glutathione-dependent formaldehyde dehydrogenase [Ectothiorhodospiraceae bacterium 2226]
MRAVCWNGPEDVRVEQVPDPSILHPRDAILKITSTAICGSDLHLYGGFMPGMRRGDILGHEFMGEVVEVGPDVENLAKGDRVVVPFTITCGRCHYCATGRGSLCDNSNPNAWMAEKAFGYSPAGLYGYTHVLGGYAGGQAEYVRVPFADSGPLKVPESLPDEKVLFLSDILPTGYQAAVNCDIKDGDAVAVWGAGPVGLFAIQSALLLGAERVVAIDLVPERLAQAKALGNGQVETLHYENDSVLEALDEITGGRGPDACIEAVGMEAHGMGLTGWYDKTKQGLMLETDRPTALRQAILACGKGGTVSIPGVFGGFIDKLPMGAAFNKSLTFKMGQTHVPTFMPELLRRIEREEIDPSFVISHEVPLDQAPEAYRLFRDKQDGCTKVVLKPH